jgi:hypothetical protein
MTAAQVARYLVVMAALLAMPLGCKKKSTPAVDTPLPKPSLGTVSVDRIPAVDFRGESVQIEATQLAEKVKAMLMGAGIFAEPGAKQPVVLVGVAATPFAEGSADALEIGIRLRLRMTVRPEGAAEARFLEDAVGVGQAPLATRDVKEAEAAWARLAERTAGDLVSLYVRRQKLWSGGSKEVAAALHAADRERRVEALRVIGGRKLRELLPAVLQLLSDEDEAVRDAALGAVVLLGERSAVKALTESRQLRDLREMRKVLDAIASLGGPEAKDYLGFVAENHDDEEIREMAKSALERMTRRAGSM